MESIRKAGKLVIIGGAENKDRDCEILRQFVRYAGRDQARVAVLTAATSKPREVGKNYVHLFKQLDVQDAYAIDTIHRKVG